MPRPCQRVRLESGLKLDLNRLARRGFIQPGAYKGSRISWTNSYTGERSIAARLKELQSEAAAKHQITVESMIEDFAQDAKDAKADKQHGAAVSARTAIAKLAGLWVDRAENINGNYAISDTPLSEQEWVEKHVKH